MTLLNKHGADNVIDAIKLTIGSQLAAMIATYNAATSVQLIARIPGPYAFGGDNGLSLSLNHGTQIDIPKTVLSGTMTTAQVVTACNAWFADPAGDGSVAALHLVASVVMGNYFAIAGSVCGVAESLAALASAGCTTFGWIANTVVEFFPLRDLQWIGETYENVEAIVPSYPALIMRCVRAQPDYPQYNLFTYDIAMRLRDIAGQSDMGIGVYRPLLIMADMIVDMLRKVANSGLLGQVNTIAVSDYKPSTSLEFGGGTPFGHVDFTLTIQVQEEVW